jgi:hypothetical protein
VTDASDDGEEETDEDTYSESDDDHKTNEDWPSSPRALKTHLDSFADVSDTSLTPQTMLTTLMHLVAILG